MSSKLNIVADQQITLAAEVFEQFGQLTLLNGREINRQSLQDADVLLVRSVTRVNANLLHDTPVRFVGSATAGIDHIDEAWLKNSGISFAYAPGSNARSVAEYVLSSLLNLAHRDGFDLHGKTIGIIGVGEVGSRVRRLLELIGMRCLLNDPPRAERDTSEAWLPLAALTDADIITCHVPLTETGIHATHGLIARDFLEQLPQHAIIINTARGGVVNETDLMAFKASRPAAHLVVDVWENEPAIDSELLQLATLTTPHIAGYSYDGKLKATEQLARALQAFVSTEPVAMASADEPQDIELHTTENVIFNAVTAAYDVALDSNELKQSLTLLEQKRAEYFDKLRQTYRRRREFSHTRVNAPALSETERHNLLQLGFILQ